MKKLSACVVLLILVAVALLLMQRFLPERRGPGGASIIQAELNETFDAGHPIHEVPQDIQVLDVVPTSGAGGEQGVVASISGDSLMMTNEDHPKSETAVNMSELNAAISGADEEHGRFVRIAFERAKEAMEITDMRTATIEYKDNIAIVTFPFPRQTMGERPSYPGPDYLARVKIDRVTGNVLEILGAP